MEDKKKIVLLGDSTLDNIVWVAHKGKCIKQLLDEKLPNYEIINYASDGFTSTDVLQGAFPNISFRARAESGDPFPFDELEIFNPFDFIQTIDGIDHLVLSVGGNDVREILGRMNMLSDIVLDLWTNYTIILTKLLQITKNVIIVLQYRPSVDQDNHYGVYCAVGSLTMGMFSAEETLHALMEEVYPTIFSIAKDHNLPILDLARTFDNHDESLYECQIEPSVKGGELISDMLSHIVNNHSYESSQFYVSSQGEIRVEPNSEENIWRIDPNSSGVVNQLVKGLIN